MLELLKEKEKFIIDYIKKSIAQKIKFLCQFEMSLMLIENILNEESKKIDILNNVLSKKIQKIAPLHANFMCYYPLFSVRNDAISRLYDVRFYSTGTGNREKKDEELKSIVINYSQFIENDISFEMCKRILTELVNNGFINGKRAFGGQKFILSSYEIRKLKCDIEPSKSIIQYGPEGFFEDEKLNWIFDKFDNDFIIEKFNQQKEKIFLFF